MCNRNSVTVRMQAEVATIRQKSWRGSRAEKARRKGEGKRMAYYVLRHRERLARRLRGQAWQEDEGQAMRRGSKVAVACFGCTLDDAEKHPLLDVIERRGATIVEAGESHVVSGRPGKEEWLDDQFISRCKAFGATVLVVFARRMPVELSLLMAEAIEAGLAVVYAQVGSEGRRINPQTQRRRKGQRVPMFDAIPGRWKPIDGEAFRFVEPRYSYEELAQTKVPFGELWMWKPSDYDGCERRVGDKWVPVSPPAGVEYPHTLDLASGFTFSELPARWVDWIMGQDWTYGEFRQRLRQWRGQAAIAAECERYRLVPKQEVEGSEFSPVGYFVGDTFVSSGTSELPLRPKEFFYGQPTWLAVCDTQGKPYGRTVEAMRKARQQAERLRRRGQEEAKDPTPPRWEAFEWSADDYGGSEADAEIKLRQHVEDEEYQLAEEVAKPWAEEEVQAHALACLREKAAGFPVIGPYATRQQAEEGIRELLRYERMLSRPWQYSTKEAKPRQKTRKLEGERAEEQAWYEGLEILGLLEQSGQKAVAAESEAEVEAAEAKLQEACERVSLPLKKLIVRPRGQSKESLLDVLRQAKRQAEEAIAEAGERVATAGYEQFRYRAAVLAEALASAEAKPGWAMLAYRQDPELLAAARRLAGVELPEEDTMERRAKRWLAEHAAELYTKRGERRKRGPVVAALAATT